MANLPKRVRSDKKLVYSGKKAMWKLWDQVWVYEPKFQEVETWETYTNKREALDWDAELQVYDTMDSTNIWTLDDGIVATYTFKDYDGSVLKTWTLKDWETPIPPENPTREATAEYTYTFKERSPAVWPINKDTIFTATYTATKNVYTITWTDYDDSTIDTTQVEYWVIPTHTDPTREWYTFSWWTPEVVAVTQAATYKATYTASIPANIINLNTSMYNEGYDEWIGEDRRSPFFWAILINRAEFEIGEAQTVWNDHFIDLAEPEWFIPWEDCVFTLFVHGPREGVDPEVKLLFNLTDNDYYISEGYEEQPEQIISNTVYYLIAWHEYIIWKGETEIWQIHMDGWEEPEQPEPPEEPIE